MQIFFFFFRKKEEERELDECKTVRCACIVLLLSEEPISLDYFLRVLVSER